MRLGLAYGRLALAHGPPRLSEGRVCPVALLGLGKFGGRELGYASDLELMAVYEGPGTTERSGTSNGEFFERLVQDLVETLEAREEGIFHIDLRLRPHGKKGALASPLGLLRDYYRVGGEAHAFERQALIKMRAVAGDRGPGPGGLCFAGRLRVERRALGRGRSPPPAGAAGARSSCPPAASTSS